MKKLCKELKHYEEFKMGYEVKSTIRIRIIISIIKDKLVSIY